VVDDVVLFLYFCSTSRWTSYRAGASGGAGGGLPALLIGGPHEPPAAPDHACVFFNTNYIILIVFLYLFCLWRFKRRRKGESNVC